MYEIEAKAHVHDKKNVVEKLKTFAKYIKSLEKSDIYYHLDEKNITCRIRRETENSKKIAYLTYKRKEIRCENNISSEVNDEKETVVENPEAIECFLLDAGFRVNLKKQKSVEVYKYETKFGKASLELCNVEKLGDFLEVEFLSKTNDEKTVADIQGELKKIFAKCEIPESDIEPRYYKELLALQTK